MLQVIQTIYTGRLISDALSGSVYIISGNRIMSEIQVLTAKREGKSTI